MENRRSLLKRALRILLPMVVLAVIIIGSCKVDRTQIKSNAQVLYVKAQVTEILEDYSGGKAYGGAQKVVAKIIGSKYEGQLCELENSNAYQRGAFCTVGTRIIAVVKEIDGKLTGSVYNYDRTIMVYVLLGLFSLCIVLVGKKKGVASLYALVFTFICIICLYIPLLYTGINGILSALITAVIIIAVSIYILNGWSAKTVCAIIGTTTGIVLSGVIAMLVGKISNLNGYNMPDVESMIYIANNSGLCIADILYAGILISSLGAVMDVSVSIVAAMAEIYEKAPKLTTKDLFLSGMNVGHDMMGTMSNTLILAYTGSATGTIITIYAYEMSYLQIMGYNSIIIEILCGLCGTIGVILTVPIQAFLTALVLKSNIFRCRYFGNK